MKPLIGITPTLGKDHKLYQVSSDNVAAIVQAGGVPVLLPYVTDRHDMKQLIQTIDGLCMTGGPDIDPTLYGEEPHQKLGRIIPERDAFELELLRLYLETEKPFLGICRGSQILNVAAGGSLYQDIYAQIGSSVLQHGQKAPHGHGSHFVYVEKDSLLYRCTGVEKFKVNSRHHQANKKIAPSFQASGRASDGVIEAIESKDHPFVLGLQWHPENMLAEGDERSINIYQAFIQQAGQA